MRKVIVRTAQIFLGATFVLMAMSLSSKPTEQIIHQVSGDCSEKFKPTFVMVPSAKHRLGEIVIPGNPARYQGE